MARKRFTPEQIISKLREAEVLLPQGESQDFFGMGWTSNDSGPRLSSDARSIELLNASRSGGPT